jgi:hypothetical protein
MNATETLEHEHRVIEQVASACGVCESIFIGMDDLHLRADLESGLPENEGVPNR